MSAHSLFHNLQYFTNAHMSEGALRNTHLEITQVRESMTAVMKTRAKACSELIRWAGGLDDPAVLQLITGLGELEVKSNAASSAYVSKYREFCEVFRDILLEKQELNNLRKAAKRAKTALEKCTVKARQLEMKLTNAPAAAVDARRKQLDLARAELTKAQAEDAAIAERVTAKALEVQQQLHSRLRSAYYLLSTASMEYLHACADVQEEMLRSIAIFPTVRGRDSSGSWQYTTFSDTLPRTDPIWHHGERFAQLLDLQREGVTAQLDREGKAPEAKKFYIEGCEALILAAKSDPDARRKAEVEAKIRQYIARAETLSSATTTPAPSSTPAPTAAPQSAQPLRQAVGPVADALRRGRARYLNAQAEHEAGHFVSAKRAYADAAQEFITAAEQADDPATRDSLRAQASAVLDALQRLTLALERRAEADQEETGSSGVIMTGAGSSGGSGSGAAPRSAPTPRPAPARSSSPVDARSQTGGTSSTGERLTDAEVAVLRETSTINGRVHPPWHAADATDFKSIGGVYEDPAGLLALAPKQRTTLARWVRPQDLCPSPKIVDHVSSACVCQTVVSDCSLISSLAICADYEKRFARRIVTNCIFPQDSRGNPVFNPHGKYIVRLCINGTWRRVTIDDRLPVGPTQALICSFSSFRDEFWVSLIEKAYMKVMGGYDFPGSNSNIDLLALTGWIPERLPLKECEDRDWSRLLSALRHGDVLITMATGTLSDAEADRAGLVPTHAYALLDMQEVAGQRLVLLRNPWDHLRWKGRFSPSDTASWTPELQRALKYDLEAARKVDNGTFWMDWFSAKHFFDVLYCNWNPALLPHRRTAHCCWLQDVGPVKDLYNLEHNPQFGVVVAKAPPGTQLCVLLSRHITAIDDFANNKEFITLHVYAGGKRVYYPDKPLVQGVKINSPLYLARVEVPAGGAAYTFVVSQFEKANTIRFSVHAYCSADFTLTQLPSPYKHSHTFNGEWTPATAGGSTNNPALYARNPQYAVKLSGPGAVFVKLECPRQYAAGINVALPGSTINSGAYRNGFCYLECAAPAGPIRITPSTFEPAQIGAFFLTVRATVPFDVLA
eukprot:m.132646 g.132646  ORF g.132646 m.132646 type:complete len:1072 (-) comp14815_c0_seq1:35-3250(-)